MFVCGSETSRISAAEAVVDVDATAGGGVDDVNADRDGCCDEFCACLSDSETRESWKKTNTCFNEGGNNECYFFHRYLLLKMNG